MGVGFYGRASEQLTNDAAVEAKCFALFRRQLLFGFAREGFKLALELALEFAL